MIAIPRIEYGLLGEAWDLVEGRGAVVCLTGGVLV